MNLLKQHSYPFTQSLFCAITALLREEQESFGVVLYFFFLLSFFYFLYFYFSFSIFYSISFLFFTSVFHSSGFMPHI